MGAQAVARTIAPRIYNGNTVSWSHHSDVARIDVKIDGSHYLCGGSFLSENWVLTAGHCASDWDVPTGSDGSTRAVKPTEVGPGQLTVESYTTSYSVDRVKVNPNFRVVYAIQGGQAHLQYVHHDAALLHLSSPATGVDHVELLDDGSSVTPDSPLMSYGWGDTDPSEKDTISSGGLQATQPNSVYPVGAPFPKCDPTAYQGFDDQPTILCVETRGTSQTGAGAGDSGGPWFITGQDGVTRQVGITSFGPATGMPTSSQPEMEAYVPELTSWIVTTTNGEASGSSPAGSEGGGDEGTGGDDTGGDGGTGTGGSGSLSGSLGTLGL